MGQPRRKGAIGGRTKRGTRKGCPTLNKKKDLVKKE